MSTEKNIYAFSEFCPQTCNRFNVDSEVATQREGVLLWCLPSVLASADADSEFVIPAAVSLPAPALGKWTSV